MGGLCVSPNGVYKTLVRHGLNTRAKRLALVAGYRAPFAPPRDPAPEPHIESSRPGELVGIDCFYVGRLHGTRGPVWQITAIDTYSSYAWADLVACQRAPTVEQTPALARRVAAELQAAGWRLERVLSDNGGESAAASSPADCLPARVTARSAPDARKPTGTSNAYTARSSKNAGDPPSRATSKSASAACDAISPATCTTTTTTANTTDESRPGDARPNSSTVPRRWSPSDMPMSAPLGVCSAWEGRAGVRRWAPPAGRRHRPARRPRCHECAERGIPTQRVASPSARRRHDVA